jgi:hypothetical protein
MKTLFGFLTSTHTYSAELPAAMSAQPELYGVFSIDGDSRSLHYAPAGRFDDGHAGLRKVGEQTHGNTPVTIYANADPPLTMPYWNLGRGFVWTHFVEQSAGNSRLDTVLAGLTVALDRRGLPRVSVGSPFARGNVRLPDERDRVVYAVAGARPAFGSIVFSDTGALGTDGVQTGSQGVIVSAHSMLGVTVTADGPTALRGDLERIVRDAAASIAEA